MKYILGHKIGMSQLFDKNGKLTPVTLIVVGPCYVLQKKNKDKDGYEALQVGFTKIEKKNKIGKSMKGKEYKNIIRYNLLYHVDCLYFSKSLFCLSNMI